MKIFIANFRKQKFIGLLNICTLSLGIMAAVIVGLWVMHELSFDQFHQDGDRIHRIIMQAPMNGASGRMASTFSIYGSQVKEKFPSVEDFCRFVKNDDGSIQINNVLFPRTFVYLADQNFFSFFTFPLKEGTPDLALSSPDKVVISESVASRYFPQQNAIGQIVKYANRDFTVSGIMKDMPQNSSLQTDFVFPFFGRWLNDEWGNTFYHHTFLLLQKGLSAEEMNAPVAQILYDAMAADGGPDPKEMGIEISLGALNNVHFDTDLLYDFTDIKGSKDFIMIFALTALMILIISCINFANLFVSTSFIRAKTIGMKKCAGAGKMTLMREFYLETACYVIVSVILGLFFVIFTMPVFNNFTQSDFTVDFTSPVLYGFLAVLFTVTVLLAGSYPALYMTRFNVVETLSGKFKGRQASAFQKGLMVVQFAVSITLMTVTVFMQKQVNHIMSYDLGFDKEHILYVEGWRTGFDRNFNMLAAEFLKEPAITGITRKNVLPTMVSGFSTVEKIPSEGQQSVRMEICFVSPNYFDVLGMKFTDGENPFLYESSGNDAVLNESAIRMLGLSQADEKLISVNGNQYTVKGVIKDAYTKSLHQEVAPQIYRKISDSSTGNVVFFKIKGDPQRAIGFIEQKWKERVDDFPFEYSFLDDTYSQLYKTETNAGKVYAFATLIVLIITVSGLFAMAYYVTRRRLREIAVCKVHGASLKDIFILLNKGLLLWTGIAFLIACPIAYYGLQKWLSGFAVRTPLSIWVFLPVGAVALLITLLTTGYQTWKAATENPVNALKSE